MTKQDLHLLYRQETGVSSPGDLNTQFDLDQKDAPEIQEYIDWLENKVLTLQNL